MTEPLDWARVPVASLGDPKLRTRLGRWEKLNRQQGRVVETRREGRTLVLEAHEGGPQARSDFPSLDQQIAAAFGWNNRPWRTAGIKDALGVPAIHRAVGLISKTAASMSLNVYQRGRKLPAMTRPRLAVRPDPFRTAHDFFRDTAYNMATRGEAWWWIAKRDSDGYPLSLMNIDPIRLVLRPPGVNDDQRYPVIELDGKVVDREDYRQITLFREPDNLRGYGPLQMCLAELSIAVESQNWAANFFAAGGYPNILIKVAGQLGGDEDGWSTEDQVDDGATTEALRLKNEWISTSPNTPKVIDDSIDSVEKMDVDASGAQMLQARLAERGEWAVAFGIPGKFAEFIQSGASLTYQNLAEVKQELVDLCVGPYYLEPIEQTFSDLLSRDYTAQFNRFAFLQADIKTRYEVYELGVMKSGVLTIEEAREMEGLEPGDVETAPVPLPVPSAIPTSLPVEVRTVQELHCDGTHVRRRSGVPYLARCGRKLSDTGVFVGQCPRCKKVYEAA